MTPTPQQQAFIDAVTALDGNLALMARAGTGKTSTILGAVDALRIKHPQLSVQVCAFNRAIADEVGAKLKARGHTDWKMVGANTAHGMGWGLVRFAFKGSEVMPSKMYDMLKETINNDQTPAALERVLRDYGAQVLELVSKAKQAGVGFFDDAPISDVGTWARIAEHYAINGLDNTDAMDLVIRAAQHMYKASLADTMRIDYDDQVLFPLVKNLRVKFVKDVIFVDEAQDISRARQALVRKFVAPNGFLHIVGDDRQAIYGFSGADADAMPNMIEALDATVMPLTVTFRCPNSVVRLAQKLVPDIEAAPDAIEGEVVQLPIEALKTTEFVAGEAILCRNTAPLIMTAYSLIRRGIACYVEGRDIGNGLARLAQRWKVNSTDDLLARLEDYEAREVQQAVAKGQDRKAEEITDKVNTLREIIAAVAANGKHEVGDVVAFITNLFGDAEKMDKAQLARMVTLATYHRAKGREWHHVFLVEHALRCPSKAARQDWQIQQEHNLSYVAITRAMQTLTFIG